MLLIIILLPFICYGIHKFLTDNQKYISYINSLPELLQKPLGKCFYCFSFWLSVVVIILSKIKIENTNEYLSIILKHPITDILWAFFTAFMAIIISKTLEVINEKKELIKGKTYTERLIQQGHLINNEILKNKNNGQ